jgi:hypothetical protein
MKAYEFMQDMRLSKELLTNPDREFVNWVNKSETGLGYLCLIYLCGLFFAIATPSGWVVAIILLSEPILSHWMVGSFSREFKHLWKENK